MHHCATGAKTRSGPLLIGTVGILGACLFSELARGKEIPDNSTAERLLEEAHEAEIAGEIPRYFALLRQAIRLAPDYRLARWQFGQVEVDGEWLAVEEAQRRAAANPRYAEYRELRAAHGDNPAGQLALARWCRRHGLGDEARFHWASVLSVDPNNEESQRAVGMRWHEGQLLSHAQIEQAKRRAREMRRSYERWSSRVANWERAVRGRSKISAQSALDEIRALHDPDAIAAIESVTLNGAANAKRTQQRGQIGLAFVKALGGIGHQDATESLVRHAVRSPLPDVRAQAAEQLRYRPPHDYVPLLLNALMPEIESWFQINRGSDGSVYYEHSLYRKGSEAALSVKLSRSARQHDRRAPTFALNRDGTLRKIGLRESDASVADRMAKVAATSQQQFATEAVLIEQTVEQQNQATATFNERITQVLASTTGEDFGNDPMAWSNWWNDYNEYYSEGEPPSYDQHYVDNKYYYYRQPEVLQQRSCFAEGTLVWTKTGQRPIESLELGDLVLAQNVDTGELLHQPVIGRTVRPPSAILKLAFASEELRTTLGHPLWVAGVGWRMAKELGDGAILHGVTGAPRVESITSDGEEEAYNLVVADFNTYFVGEAGILVHDNTPRRPTRATVPGMSIK